MFIVRAGLSRAHVDLEHRLDVAGGIELGGGGVRLLRRAAEEVVDPKVEAEVARRGRRGRRRRVSRAPPPFREVCPRGVHDLLVGCHGSTTVGCGARFSAAPQCCSGAKGLMLRGRSLATPSAVCRMMAS